MQYSLLQIETAFADAYMKDILVYELSELGFDSFLTDTPVLQAFIPSHLLDEQQTKECLQSFPYKGILSFSFEKCEDKDWNAEWEKNFFNPIVVDNRCVIHSSFAKDVPECKYDIVIDPKMAFGTGHHQTTSLMLRAILDLELDGRSFLDMGCGTAVLAILAHKRGAAKVTAVDIDDWCTRNATENTEANHAGDIEVVLGDARVLAGRHFDVIAANINRNILLSDMAVYAGCLNAGGHLLLSGFYTEDVPVLEAEAQKYGLHAEAQNERDNWCQLTLKSEK